MSLFESVIQAHYNVHMCMCERESVCMVCVRVCVCMVCVRERECVCMVCVIGSEKMTHFVKKTDFVVVLKIAV